MDPNQQPASVPGVAVNAQVSAQPNQLGTFTSQQDFLLALRRKVLRIIFTLSIVSVLSVSGIYWVTVAEDDALQETTQFSNTRAQYEVPSSWNQSVEAGVASYVNGESGFDSQVNMVVVDPERANFNSKLLTEKETLAILSDYEDIINQADQTIRIDNRREVDDPFFERVYDYDISGTANDGLTKIRGISRVYFDDRNFIHTVEIIAVSSYWQANESSLLEILESYQLKGDL